MAGGKTTQTGLGGAKPNRSTRVGLKVERKKIITKRGMVAPSPDDPARLEEFIPESDRKKWEAQSEKKSTQPDPTSSESGGVHRKTTDPMGLTAPPPLAQMQGEAGGPAEYGLTDVDSTRELETDPVGMDPFDPEEGSEAERLAARIAAHEDVTPSEGTLVEDPDARARFRTAPGGGLNRMSGGREQARAYVSPVTVKPGTPTTPVTGAVKVLDVVEKAVRAYQTEPSLLKRRLSSLPPTQAQPQTRMHLLIGVIAVGLVVGAMLVWAVIRTTAPQPEEPGPATKLPPAAARPAFPNKQKISRNESESGPKTVTEGENNAEPEAAPQGQQPTPPAAQKSAAPPSTSISKPVHAEAPVENRPRSDTKPAVEKPLPAEAEKPPTKDVGASTATKTSSQDLWLE